MSYSSEVLADSPWGYWRLQETSGTTLADSSGHSRPLTIQGSAATLNQAGPVTSDATSTAISWSTATGHASSSATVTTSTASVEVWVKVAALPASPTTLFGLGDISAWDKDLILNSDGSLDWYVYNGFGVDCTTAAGTISAGSWYHIVATVGAGGMKVYVNGSQAGTDTNTGSYNGGAEPVNLRWSQQATASGAVQLAEPAFYTTQLSATRVTAHYNAAIPPAGALSGSTVAELSTTATISASTALTASTSAEVTTSATLSTGSQVAITASADAEVATSATLTAGVAITASTSAEVTTSATLTLLQPLSTATGAQALQAEVTTSATIELDAAVVTPPANVTVTYIRRVSPVMPTPTLVDGVPQNWTATSTTDEDWFRWQVIIGGVDVTYFRNVEVELGNLSFSEPFSEEALELRFPQITTFDQPNTGITWLKAGNDVTINRVYASDGHRERHFEGQIVSHEPEQDENGYAWAVHCEGVLRQAQHGVQTPPAYLDATDLGVRIPSVFNDMPARRYAMCAGITTGITTRQRGSLSQSRLQLAEDLLAASTLNDGSNDYTVVNAGHRVPKMRLKDLSTVHHVYTNGTPGLTVRLSYDLTARPTRIYGSGTRPDGGFWMGASYPTAADVYDMSINPLAEDAAQSGFFPIERYTAYGEGITKTTATGSAQAELVRLGNPGWTGTLTCRIDPEGGSRFEIREGQNVQLKSFAGSNILLHVARVEQNPKALTVTLTVDTLARSLQSLAAIRDRNAEAKQDPVGRARQLRRQSRDMIDKTVPFDSEAGAGTVPSTSCTGGQWTRIRVPFGQVGDIVDGLLSTSPAVSFAAALWDNEVSLSWLAGFGNPLTATSIWDTHWTALADAGWLEGWGDNNQAAGYSDSNATPATLTGKLRTGGFPYSSTRPPWVWLTVWPSSTTTISGSFTAAPPQI